MSNETPRDLVDAAAFDDAAGASGNRNTMATDLLDTPGGDGSPDEALGLDAGGDGGTLLMPHERELPVAEQRRIIAMRKRHGDGIDDDDSQAMGGGKRGRGRRRPADQALDPGHRRGPGGLRHGEIDPHLMRPEANADAADTGGGGGGPEATEPTEPVEPVEPTEEATGSGSGGGSHIEHDSDAAMETTLVAPETPVMADDTARRDDPAHAGTPQAAVDAPVATVDDTMRLDDPAHPHAPLYGAALKAVAELAPAQAAMGPAEQANIAAALTARMAGDATFAQQLGDPSRLSFGLAQNGDRLFAINHPVPDAPNAVHVSVDLEQARTQSVEASSGRADIAATVRDPAHGQSLETHALETPAREHAPRQA